MTDYPCANFVNFSFSRFGFIAWTDRQTDRQTDTRTHRIIHSDTDAAKRFTPATVVGVSNKKDGYSQQNVRQRQKLISIIDYDVCILEYLQPF